MAKVRVAVYDERIRAERALLGSPSSATLGPDDQDLIDKYIRQTKDAVQRLIAEKVAGARARAVSQSQDKKDLEETAERLGVSVTELLVG